MKEILKTYGPYVRKEDGRKIIIIYYIDGTKTTQTYAKYLMEKQLNRHLDPVLETADHINNDPSDDRLENLQLLTRAENARKAWPQLEQWYYFKCPVCNKDSKKLYKDYRSNQLCKGRAGPYCSRRCASKVHN